jgi:hypothetical protein
LGIGTFDAAAWAVFDRRGLASYGRRVRGDLVALFDYEVKSKVLNPKIQLLPFIFYLA